MAQKYEVKMTTGARLKKKKKKGAIYEVLTK